MAMSLNMLSGAWSGLVGAVAVTILHEAARRSLPQAPRMDILGERAIEKVLHAMGQETPPEERLHALALAGDLFSNSLYYSMVSQGDVEGAPARGALLGLLAGIGAVTLPGPMGLGKAPSARSGSTAAMTVGLYLAGGLAAGIAHAIANRRRDTAPWEEDL